MKVKRIAILLLIGLFVVFILFMGVGCTEAAHTEAVQVEEVQEEAPTEEAAEEVIEEEVTITFWGFGPVAEAVKNVAGPAFTKLHPNVAVEVVMFGPWDMMDKFYSAIVSGEGLPDCAMTVRRMMDKYLMSELLYDFTDFVNVEHKGEFTEAFTVDVTSPDGKVLAVAATSGPTVIFYNKQLAEELGLNVDEIVTWDDYYNICMDIGTANPDVYLQPLYYPGGTWGSNNWRIYVQSAGANIYDEEGMVIEDNEKLKEITRFFYKLHTDINIITGAVNDPAIFDAFYNDEMLFYPANSQKLMALENAKPGIIEKLGVIPWPLWSKDAPATTGNWGGEAMTVPKNAPNAEIAAEFVKFLTTSEEVMSGMWVESASVPNYGPIREKLLETTDLGSTAHQELLEAVEVREVATWHFFDWAQTEKILGDNLDAMIAGNMTPDEMWDTTAAQLKKILER